MKKSTNAKKARESFEIQLSKLKMSKNDREQTEILNKLQMLMSRMDLFGHDANDFSAKREEYHKREPGMDIDTLIKYLEVKLLVYKEHDFEYLDIPVQIEWQQILWAVFLTFILTLVSNYLDKLKIHLPVNTDGNILGLVIVFMVISVCSIINWLKRW